MNRPLRRTTSKRPLAFVHNKDDLVRSPLGGPLGLVLLLQRRPIRANSLLVRLPGSRRRLAIASDSQLDSYFFRALDGRTQSDDADWWGATAVSPVESCMLASISPSARRSFCRLLLHVKVPVEVRSFPGVGVADPLKHIFKRALSAQILSQILNPINFL
jgi:hypothetical protein